jgi:hypothetical protein
MLTPLKGEDSEINSKYPFPKRRRFFTVQEQKQSNMKISNESEKLPHRLQAEDQWEDTTEYQ